MEFQTSGMPLFGGGGVVEQPAGPSLQFSVPCLEVVDEENKPPSFNYLFYELPLPEIPFSVSFYVANGWCNAKGSYIQSMEIVRPDKSTSLVRTGDQPFQLTDPATPFMAVNFFQNIAFPEAGTYWFRVYLGGKKVLEYPMTVRLAKAK